MKAMNDQEMVIRAQQGDLEAEESLMRKYKEIVKIKSRYYYMAGADEDDVVQEGMIGTSQGDPAVRSGKRSQLCDLRWSLHNQTDYKCYSYGRPGKA